MHREDIFLCRNLLSERPFELCSDGESKTPPENSGYNLKQCFDFQTWFQNQFQLQTRGAAVELFQSERLIEGEHKEWDKERKIHELWHSDHDVYNGAIVFRMETHSVINAALVAYYCPYQITLN